jgi:hypothetical protein
MAPARARITNEQPTRATAATPLKGRRRTETLLLLALQMVGTVMPLILFPLETFTIFPFAPTIEGQYIIKNVVLIGAGMVIGATLRGGRLTADPRADRPW